MPFILQNVLKEHKSGPLRSMCPDTFIPTIFVFVKNCFDFNLACSIVEICSVCKLCVLLYSIDPTTNQHLIHVYCVIQAHVKQILFTD